ncbi:class I SAM-dependent methyltransferase [Larkinella sp. VNQ87]|uniref:class I SAM-dependent methyltransferase n=1 Tax=Larkinella sp. VNQ87 TaxID=3400921 RepID=UPI003C10EF3C
MELQEAIELIQYDRLPQSNPATWADLGCGSGLFTFALAARLTHPGTIYAVDQQPVRLLPLPVSDSVTIETRQCNFVTDELGLTGLDGILMANSLHFVADKPALIRKLERYLNPKGGFLLVEYDTDKANSWVPFPTSYRSLKKLFETVGYTSVTWLNERPSRYGRANLYAAFVQK